METIKTATSRIHPLVAAAAVSVIVVSLAGTAAITGLLPSSHSAPEAAAQVNPAYAAAPTTAPALPMAADATAPQGLQPVQGAYAQPAAAAYAQPAVASAQPAPAPTVIKETIIREVPAKPAPRHTTHHTSYAQHDTYREPAYREPAPRPQPAQPNYVAIGTGAVVGGLLGNQVGSGNGRKLATVAGIIGGGMLGNQIANQNQGR
jgi:uncharacterized protein YcfJ